MTGNPNILRGAGGSLPAFLKTRPSLDSSATTLTRLLTSLIQLLLLLAPLLLLQRKLQQETQAIFLLLTRRVEIAIALFSFLFFPGVLLHEASHYITALVLGVKTGRFSILPRALPNGRLQLGYVETAAADPLRETLIGAAPLVFGGACVAYIGLARLGLSLLWSELVGGGPEAFLRAFPAVYARPDFWLWFYLAFAISSTMLPSASDRRSWLVFSLVAGFLLGATVLVGAGPWLLLHLASPLNRVFQTVAVVLAISIFLHLLLLPPLWGLRRLISRVTGLQVV